MGQEGRAHAAAHVRAQRIADVDDGDGLRARPQRDPQRPPGRIEREVPGAGADLDARHDRARRRSTTTSSPRAPSLTKAWRPSGRIAA